MLLNSYENYGKPQAADGGHAHTVRQPVKRPGFWISDGIVPLSLCYTGPKYKLSVNNMILIIKTSLHNGRQGFTKQSVFYNKCQGCYTDSLAFFRS